MDDFNRVQSLEDIAALSINTQEVFVSSLDDVKIEVLSKLKNLKKITQDGNCLVTDKGLKTLGTFTSLEELDLEWSENITDAGLAELYTLSKLRWLDIGFCTNLTDSAVDLLCSKLPLCEIVS